MAEPDLIIEAGFSDAKLAREVQKVVAKYKDAGKAAEKAFQDSTGKVGESQALKAHMRELDKLKRAYDPVYTATKRYEGEVDKLNRALQIGAITQGKYSEEVRAAQVELGRASGVIEQAEGAIQSVARRAQGGADGFRNLGFQVQDFAVQVGAGTSATQAFAQQFPQLISGFGAVGIAIGTFSAIAVPLGAALLKIAFDSQTLDERLKELQKSTDAMSNAVEAAATPISTLRSRYGELADEVARANSAMAMMTTIRAQADAMGAARGLSGPVGNLNPVRIDGMSDQEWAAVQASMMDSLRDKTGATAEQVERLRMALNRTDSSNSLEAVARDAENLLQVIAELYTGASDTQRTFLDTWGAQVAATMNAAKDQIAAAVAEETRLFDTYDANTRKLEGLADDRAAAEKGLAEAVKSGNDEKIASYRRVIGAIDAEVAKVRDSIDQMDASFGDFIGRLKERAGEIGGTLSSAVGGIFDKYAGPGMDAIQTVKDFEGFRAKAYWDVNAYRAGFGSDTVTRADGRIEKVTQDTVVTLADANRDLARRIGEFQAAIIGQIGPDRWSQFTQEQQAALTSIAYNYGSLPDRIMEAVTTGTVQDIATSIGRLAGDNGGVNETRRMREAAAFGTTSAASAELTASRTAAAEQQRIADAQRRTEDAGARALDQALERAMALKTAAGDTVQVITEQEGAWEAVAGSIFSAVQASEDLDDALKNVALSLLDMAAQGALLGQGPLAGIFGGLFGGVRGGDALSQALRGAIGARALGGPVNSGSPYLVGERGPEIIVPRSAGQVIPNHKIGGGMTFAPSTSIIVQGNADERTLTLMRHELDARDRRLARVLPGQVQTINRDPLRR